MVIAVRVMQTAKTMGYQTVAVYSDADAMHAMFQVADEAVYIGRLKFQNPICRLPTLLKPVKRQVPMRFILAMVSCLKNTDFAQACIDDNGIFIGPNCTCD